MVDLLVRNGKILDGTGRPAFTGDIGIKDGVIEFVLPEETKTAAGEVIDASGLWVMPGFIDIHRHGDLVPFLETVQGEELRQGITTFINGNCGFSAVPSSTQYFELLRDYSRPILGEIPEVFKGMGQRHFMEQAAAAGRLPSNMGYLVGNGALRIAVKGFSPEPMNREEMERVKGLLKECLKNGAMGLSLGLMYVPENFYSLEELKEICQIPAQMGKIVTVHMRGEGSSLLEAVREVICLAESSGGKFHISHLKAAGKKNWGKMVRRVLEQIREARDRGIDIDFDVYPYCAGSTALYTLLPPKAMEGGVEGMLLRLREPEMRRQICGELREEQNDWDNLVASTGWDSVVIMGGKRKGEVGKNLKVIAEERGIAPEECVLELLLENEGNVPIVFYSMCQEDMEYILWSPESVVISDALYSSGGMAHPRKYGTFAKLISSYREQKSIEEIVAKITSLPARRLGIDGRGCLAAGFKADLVVVDPEQFEDKASYEEPERYPEGIRLVAVNGKIACQNGKVRGCFGELIC